MKDYETLRGGDWGALARPVDTAVARGEFPVLDRDLFAAVGCVVETRADAAKSKLEAVRRAPKIYRDLDELECLAVKIVGGLSYSVGCFDKRFAREIAGVTKATEGQMAQVWRYRRQIQHEKRAELLAVAQVRGAVDFRTRQGDLEKRRQGQEVGP